MGPHGFTGRIENPDDIKMTLTVTMKLSEWKFIRKQLDGCFDSNRLATPITEMVNKVEQEFYVDTKN